MSTRGGVGSTGSSARIRQILMIVGMSMTWMFMQNRLLYPLNYTFDNTHDIAVYSLHVVYSIVLIAVTFAIGVASLRFNLSSTIASKGLLLSTGTGASIGTLLLSLLDFSNTINLVAMGISLAFVALYVPTHILFWSQNFGQAQHKGALSDAACSVVLFEAVFSVLLISDIGTLPLAIAAPLISALLGTFLLSTAPDERSLDDEIRIPRIADTMMVSTLVLILLSDLTVIFFNQSAQLQGDVPLRALADVGNMLIFVLIAWFYLPRKKRITARINSFILVSLVYVGMLLITLFVPAETLSLGTVPLNCASSGLICFMWLLLVQIANKQHMSLTSCMALFLSLFVLLPRFIEACIMYNSNYVTAFAQSISSLYIIALVVFFVIILLIATLLAFFNGRNTHIEPTQKMSDPNANTLGSVAADALSEHEVEIARQTSQHEKALLALGKEAKLTDREMEIARMILRNKSANRIAEDLFISKNTVYTHMKHIYQKTEVHSRQEFIDLIESRS